MKGGAFLFLISALCGCVLVGICLPWAIHGRSSSIFSPDWVDQALGWACTVLLATGAAAFLLNRAFLLRSKSTRRLPALLVLGLVAGISITSVAVLASISAVLLVFPFFVLFSSGALCFLWHVFNAEAGSSGNQKVLDIPAVAVLVVLLVLLAGQHLVLLADILR